MLLRKSRKHLHGSSNKSAQMIHSSVRTIEDIAPRPFLDLPKKSIFTSTLKKRLRIKEKNMTTQQDTIGQEENVSKSSEMLAKIKGLYQGKKSVLKLFDGWGFDSKGYITKQHFKRQLEQRTHIQISDKDLENMLKRSAVDHQMIGVHDFLTLMHGRSDGIVFNKTLFNPKEQSSARNQKIQNLKETLKNFKKAEKQQITEQYLNSLVTKINFSLKKMKSTGENAFSFTESKEQFFSQLEKSNNFDKFDKENLKIISNEVNFNEMKYLLQCNKHADNLLLDPILRKTNKRSFIREVQGENKDQSNYADIMMKTTNSFNYFVKNQEKVINFDPKSMTNVNQQKTRFGNSIFTRSSQSGNLCLQREDVKPNQKQLVIDTLNAQQNMKKQRYQNKLQRLRTYIKFQKQNIDRRQQFAQEREKKRIQRLGVEQQAYNYINFIKKKWQ